MKVIQLIKTIKGMTIGETKLRYDVTLYGQKIGQLYFNLIGYTCYLPSIEGYNVNFGEKKISDIKKEVAKLNREFATALKVGETPEIAKRRREVLDDWFGQADLLGHQVEDSGNWEHVNDRGRLQDDEYTMVVFVQAPEAGQTPIKKILSATFYAGTAIMVDADLDLDMVEGAEMFPFKIVK